MEYWSVEKEDIKASAITPTCPGEVTPRRDEDGPSEVH
jgi:hypothetical protein